MPMKCRVCATRSTSCPPRRTKEPAVVSNQQSAQDFLNCALGGIIADAERQQATDREWSRTLLEPLTRASEPQDVTEAQQKKPTPQPAGQPGSDTKA